MRTILNPPPDAPRINLRDLGFVGRVSEAALREIAENEARAQRTITTAHRFIFREAGQ